MERSDLKQLLSLPVIVAALGYFVDIYDLLLFSIVRRPSLISIGVPEDQLFTVGEFLLRVQMTGLLVGGIIWGIMGDKRGRLSVLFGSILLYSLANIANGMATTVEQYAALRLIAGIGLAGELGAGITLVSEILPARIRGYATALIASIGITGAVLANFVARIFDWQIAYFIGGGLGLLLLIARVRVFESGMFLKLKHTSSVRRGNFLALFSNKGIFQRYMGCILIGLPIWYVAGILVTFAPEFASALGVTGMILAGDAVMYCYVGLAFGDFASGFISQKVGSRKKVVAAYILLTLVTVVFYLFMPLRTAGFFYFVCFLLGLAIGYWALFVTIAAEQFGTNLRSTVATTVPNFIRGTVVPLTFLFELLRRIISTRFADPASANAQSAAIVYGGLIVGVFTVVVALWALRWIGETYGRELNFEEQ